MDDAIPLLDLHRHLEGCVRLQTIIDLGRRHNLPLPAWGADSIRPFVQVSEPQPGVMKFIEKFQWITGVLVDYDACRRIAMECVEDLRLEGIAYAEVRFSPMFMAQPHGLEPAGVVEAVCDGIRTAARDQNLPVKLIGILSRTYGPETAWKELEALLAFSGRLVAIDLAGDEARFPGELFVEHIGRARDAGLHVTIHAGEAAGPQSVWQAIEGLGAERIGHAVRANEDPTLLEAMLKRGTGVEANLTSNVQTQTVGGYAEHPLRGWLERGLLATINSDDPAISGIDLRYEYEVAAPAAGLTAEQIRQAQQNALDVAFLTKAEKEGLVK